MGIEPAGTWIVELEPGVYFDTCCSGDPPRTVVRKFARQYKTASGALRGLRWCQRFRPFVNGKVINVGMSDQKADMQRKATALLRLAETCCKLTDYKFLSAMELLPALESRAEMLSAMSEQVIDVIPIMTTVIERLSEMVAELHADNAELRSLSRSLSASLRTDPRNTAT